MNTMNLTVHTLMPFHQQYQRANAVSMQKKEDSSEKKLSFQDILNEKMGKK
ncbi:hypothetical protein ABH892_003459 [Paenibacillus sp. RC254]|uniref:hypothetical protein n=1 Tax=unclassified Paenibacillus TaxID=185978 RepID=UPI0024BB0675|nr:MULTISPECIES: hypothetical protein [unclassified Paenibacillus]